MSALHVTEPDVHASGIDVSTAVVVEDLWASYGSYGTQSVAVRGVDFTVAAGEFLALLGPSGCGKTTTLRCVAGLHKPYGGRITINGTEVYSAAHRRYVAPDRRDLGMVFQSYALWPHMTALDNVAFPLRWGHRHLKESAAKQQAADTLASVGLGHLGQSFPWMLSGGQQQRVALARALVAEPAVLLLDEPLSNLDASLRAEMRNVLKEIIAARSVTSIYVTHDYSEALAMASTVGVMHDGVIIEKGTPDELYRRPRREITARATGKANIVAGHPKGRGGDDTVLVETEGGVLACRGELPEGQERGVSVFFRPESARFVPHNQSPDATDGAYLRGHIQLATYLGDSVEYQVVLGRSESLVTVRAPTSEMFAPGEEATILVAPDSARLVY